MANNWQRYWNDCSAIYSALVDVYNYEDDHIYTIMSDGTNTANDRRISGGYDSSPLDLDGDGDNDIQFSATRANITTVFNTLSGLLDCNDGYFLVFTPNPTTGETTLSIETTSKEKTFDENAEWELEVYGQGQLLKEKKTSLKGRNTKIQTVGWKDGVYLVRVKYKDEILTGKLAVKR